MKNKFTILKLSATISLLVVLPFIIMELVNRRVYHEDFPFVLFGALWLASTLFFLTLLLIVRNFRSANRGKKVFLVFGIRIAALILLAWFYISILVDQMPCFLGDINCD